MDLHRDPLAVTPEQMREIGYQTVDLLVDQLTDSSIPRHALRRSERAAPGPERTPAERPA